MSKLLPVMKEFGKDYLQEIANEQPDLVDLLILTVHLPSHKKKFILKQLNNDIKKSFLIQ
ncbi:hypothetical protein GCM10008967_15270 [Bacillus carboniphilus]|uniref:Uncharacterized protein n=1 Tax=Bacillus carboniphilus TaxID=86663 RepID=A0ABN0W5B3_9BACI